MRLDNYIAQSIRRYPDLYRDITYEKSRIKVLDHLFLVIGNGLVWQKGQLIHKDSDRSELSSDLTFEVDYFTKEIIETVTIFTIDYIFEHRIESRHEWEPYPINKYSKIVTIPDDVCDDWLMGAKEIYNHTFDFYYNKNLISKWRYMFNRPSDIIEKELTEQLSWLNKINTRLVKLSER